VEVKVADNFLWNVADVPSDADFDLPDNAIGLNLKPEFQKPVREKKSDEPQRENFGALTNASTVYPSQGDEMTAETELTEDVVKARKAEAGRRLAQQYYGSTDSVSAVLLKKLKEDEARRRMQADVDSENPDDVK
jgi:hypothetical protein